MKVRKLISMILVLVMVFSIFPALSISQNEGSPMSKGPVWTRDYDDIKNLNIYPGHDGEFFFVHKNRLDAVDEDGKKVWSKSFSNKILGSPAVKGDKLYVQTGPSVVSISEEGKFTLYCLALKDGSKIWKREIDDVSGSILVTDDHEICLPHNSGGNVTKISSEGEILWTKRYTETSFLSYGRVLDEDKILIINENPHSPDELRCISSDGSIDWEVSIENKTINKIEIDRDTGTAFVSTYKEIYILDSDGKMDKIYDVEEGEHIEDLRYKDDRFYFILKEDDSDRSYLRSVSEEGNDLFNVSLGELTWDNDMAGNEFIMMNIPGNERLYCQYIGIDEEHEYNAYEVRAFDLDGELKWKYEYRSNNIHSPHLISEDGVILTISDDGNVYAYQGYDPHPEPDSYIPLALPIVVFISVIVYFYNRKMMFSK